MQRRVTRCPSVTGRCSMPVSVAMSCAACAISCPRNVASRSRQDHALAAILGKSLFGQKVGALA
jgi:hypothetical protein